MRLLQLRSPTTPSSTLFSLPTARWTPTTATRTSTPSTAMTTTKKKLPWALTSLARRSRRRSRVTRPWRTAPLLRRSTISSSQSLTCPGPTSRRRLSTPMGPSRVAGPRSTSTRASSSSTSTGGTRTTTASSGRGTRSRASTSSALLSSGVSSASCASSTLPRLPPSA